jgi:hypothetical protein
MEPGNRPYVDPETTPGDAGTEDWADRPATPDPKVHAPTGPTGGGAIDKGIVDGSPADEFVEGHTAIGKDAGGTA